MNPWRVFHITCLQMIPRSSVYSKQGYLCKQMRLKGHIMYLSPGGSLGCRLPDQLSNSAKSENKVRVNASNNKGIYASSVLRWAMAPWPEKKTVLDTEINRKTCLGAPFLKALVAREIMALPLMKSFVTDLCINEGNRKCSKSNGPTWTVTVLCDVTWRWTCTGQIYSTCIIKQKIQRTSK